MKSRWAKSALLAGGLVLVISLSLSWWFPGSNNTSLTVPTSFPDPGIRQAEATPRPPVGGSEPPTEASIEYEDFEITFPDGDLITVTFRSWEREPYERISSLSAQFDEYEQRAMNGDATAALALSDTLRECRDFSYESEQQLTAAVDALFAENVLLLSSGERHNVPPGSVLEEAEYLKDNALRCANVPRDVFSRADEFLEISYELGSFSAVNRVAVNAPPGELKFRAFQKAWNLGDFNATGWIGKGYAMGWHGAEPDLQKAYAYSLLAHELRRIAYSDRSGAPSVYFQKIASVARHDEYGAALTHEEYTEALGYAKSLLKNNPNCCSGLYVLESAADL